MWGCFVLAVVALAHNKHHTTSELAAAWVPVEKVQHAQKPIAKFASPLHPVTFRVKTLNLSEYDANSYGDSVH